jgi:hypothetical protein
VRARAGPCGGGGQTREFVREGKRCLLLRLTPFGHHLIATTLVPLPPIPPCFSSHLRVAFLMRSAWQIPKSKKIAWTGKGLSQIGSQLPIYWRHRSSVPPIANASSAGPRRYRDLITTSTPSSNKTQPRPRYGATLWSGTQTPFGSRPVCQNTSIGMPPRGYQ